MRQVVNPYNFISYGLEIDGKKRSKEESYRNGGCLQSGWLDVKLIPTTPLIIPDGAHPIYIDSDSGKIKPDPDEKEKKKYHKQYDFMNRYDADGNKEYYIPGSSIRGMIRSVYEAATDSCVPFLLADEKKPISQRIPLFAALKKRGLLSCEKGEDQKRFVWRLYSTYSKIEKVRIKEILKTVKDWKGNERQVASYRLISEDGQEITSPTGKMVEGKGVLQYNIPVDISKDYHIAYLTKKEIVYEWKYGDEEPYRLLNSVLCRDDKKGNQVNRNEKPARDLKKALDHAKMNGGMVPVYYIDDIIRKHEDYEEKLIYLSNSSAGRIAQKRRWVDIIGAHKPCEGEKLCPACLLFGTYGTENGLKSHVRITDARAENGAKINLTLNTLDVLGGPRTSAFEFYLDHPKGASYWNFDFYSKTEKDSNGVEHTKYYDLEKAMPRGRKMYWHGKPRIAYKKTHLNATMASTIGTPFTFRVYFDEISVSQLQNLIWVLTLGDNCEKSPYQHKLGHAKPLGYGSVKLVITGGTVRKITQDSEGIHVHRESLRIDEKPQGGKELQKDLVKDILLMSDVNAAGETPVEYPIGPDGKIYSWFSENRIRAGEVQELPKPSAEDISISSNVKRSRYSSSQKRREAKEEKSYKKGDQASGKVNGYNKDKSGMYVTLENGDIRSKYVFFRNTFQYINYGEIDKYYPVGTRVILKYKGSDNKGREQWHVIKIE